MRLRESARLLDAELAERKKILVELLQVRGIVKREKTRAVAQQRLAQKLSITDQAILERQQASLKEARGDLARGARRTVAETRERSTDVLFRRRSAQASRLLTSGQSGGLSKARQAELERLSGEIDQVRDRFATLNDGLKALRETAKQSGESPAKINQQARAFATARRETAVELGRLVEDLKEVNRSARGSRRNFDSSRRLAERADELLRVGAIDSKARKDISSRLGAAGEARATGNIQEAQDITEAVNATVAAKERQLKLDRKLQQEARQRVRLNESASSSAVAREKQRQSALTQEGKALNSIRVQQQQIADLASKPGATGLSSFQRASGAVARLPQLREAGDFNEFNRVLGDATAFARIARSELGVQARGAVTRTKNERELDKINKKILSGKRLEASEVDRLNALRPPASALPALPAAAPGAAAMGGRARPLRTQSTVGGVVQPLIQEILGGGRTIEDAELSKRFADSFATKAGKKAGPKFAQVFVAGAADSFSAKQLLSGIGAAFGVLSEKSLSKTASQAVKLESGIAGVADALVNAAKANESVERAAARAAAVQAGLYDDSDLKQFVEGFSQAEKSAGNYLDTLKQTFSFQDKQRKAEEKGANNRETALDRELDRRLKLEKRQEALLRLEEQRPGSLQAGRARSLFDRLSGLGTSGRDREFTRVDKELAQVLSMAGTKKTAAAAKTRVERITGAPSSPIDAPLQLKQLQLDAENQITALNKLEAKGVDIASRRGSLQTELNRTKESAYLLSEKALKALRDEVSISSKLARNERARLTGKPGGGTGGKSGGTQDPQAAQQRLARDLFAGESLVGRLQNLERKRVAGLGAADPKTVEVTQQVVKLETQLNAAKQAGFELTKQNLDALTSTVNKSRQLLEFDAQQNKLSAETAKIRRLQSERRLPQLQRESLTSILGDLGRASSAAKVFRGGRSGEQALSNIIGAFNASVGGKTTGTGAGGPGASAGAAGQNVVDTFASRLTAGASKAAAAGMKFAGAGVDGIMKAFKIKSPSRVMIEIVLNLVNTYVSELEKAIPQIQAISEKAFAPPKSAGGPSAGIKTYKLTGGGEETAAQTLRSFGVLSPSQMENRSTALDIVRARGMAPNIGSLPEYDKAYEARLVGRATPEIEKIQAILRDFYGLAGSTGNAIENAADSMRLSEQEAKQLAQTVNELAGGLSSIVDFIKGAANAVKTTAKPATAGAANPFEDAIAKAAAIDAENAQRASEKQKIAAEFAPSIAEASRLDAQMKAKAIADQFAPSRAQAEADAKAASSAIASNVIAPSVTSVAETAVADGETEVRNAVQKLFDRIARAISPPGGGLFGGGGGGRPPVPPVAGGPDPGDFEGRINEARGSANKLLGLKDLADMSGASIKQLQLLSQALSETREGVKMTDKSFDQLTQVLNKVDDQIARRDPNADFLTRQFGQRRGQAIGEGLIGGAFPLLFGQGLGAAALGGLGGALGGFAGGTLGFGLSLAGTALGSAFDGVVQAAQDTGNTLRDLVGNFEQIKDSGLLASRSQEKLIANLLEAGNKTAAYAIIQDELSQKLGVDGAAKLREAADAGDRMKRAMADLGVQLQLFIAGPLTDFLNRISGVVEGWNVGARAERTFQALTPGQRASAESRLLSMLPESQARGVRAGSQRLVGSSLSISQAPSAGITGASGAFVPGELSLPIAQQGSTGGVRAATSSSEFAELIKLLPSGQRSRFLSGLESLIPKAKQSPEEQRSAAIRSAEDLRDQAQRNLDASTKRNEGNDILKGFKQQANAIKREQEDLDRQSFETRRDYERQIEDIRRGVEDKISQLRQENAQKELEILVKQGQIREQQFQNAALALQGALAGDPLAQSLADAVTTYLGAQLSAQNEIEQRRKQFEIEISNQQVELEKYKADVARSVAQLNLSTAEKVQEINRSIARRNEDAALNSFAAEKKVAKLKAEVIQNELLVMQARQKGFVEESKVNVSQNPGKQVYIDIRDANQAIFDNITENIKFAGENLKAIEATQAPPRLKEIPAVSAKGVSFAGVNAQKVRGDQLRNQFQAVSDELTELATSGKLQEFANRISEIASGSFFELSNGLETARKELALLGGDFGPIADGIRTSYQDLIKTAAQQGKPFPQAVQDFLLNDVVKAQIAYEKLRPTLQFYADGFQDLRTQTDQARASISELLSPTKNYDRLLEQINKRGGLGVNEEKTRALLQYAKNLDELNAQLKVLNGLNDIAGGWTDSFIQLNKELLKGGNLLESVQRFAESVADRTLDVVLEFTLRPIQEQLFKNLTSFLGIEAPQDPMLLPIRETAANTKGLLDIAKGRFAGKTGVALPQAVPAAAPANAIVPGPSATPAAGAFDTGMRTGPAGRIGAGTEYHQDIMFGGGVSLEERVRYMDQLARGYEAMGRVIEFSNAGVAGRRYMSTDSIESRRQLILDAQAAHANRPGGSGRAAMDFYAPLMGQTRFGPSVEGQSMLAPVVPGGSASYSSGGGAGRKMTMMKNGQMIYEMLHGDTGVPLRPVANPAMGPRSSAMPIGDQFLSQILGSQFEDVAQGGARSAQNASSAAQGLRTLRRKVDSLIEWTLQNTKDVNSVGDVDFPGRRQPTLGKSALTRPTGAMVGLAIGGELGDSLIEYINSEFKKRQKLRGPQSSAMPIGEQFTAMLSGSRFASIASTKGPSGVAYPLSETAPGPTGGVIPPEVVPYQEAAPQVKNLGDASSKAAASLMEMYDQAAVAADKFQDFGTNVGESVTKFQQIVGTGLQAISSVAMGIGGAQMIRKGGTYNTLMGAASIFGSIGSIAGMFGGGGKSAGVKAPPGFDLPMLSGIPGYASGGRPEPFMPALIGEEGPELWVPDRPGTIIPNDELYVPGLDDKGGSAPPIGRYARRAGAGSGMADGGEGDSSYSEMYQNGGNSTTYTSNYGRAVPYQRSETTREIDRLERVASTPKELPPIKYETTRVNEYEFVTPEQLEASNARTAKIARNQTIRELADSMKTRKRLGL